MKTAFHLLLLIICFSAGVVSAQDNKLWSNPVFQKKLMGSFGFSSEVEPSMSDSETEDYRQIAPLLQSDPDEALKYLTQLRDLPDSSARFDFLIGNIHFQKGDREKAAANFLLALNKFPDYRQAHSNLAIIYVQAGAHEKAVRHFTEAIRLGSTDGTTYGLLAVSYLTLERYVAAEEGFRNAMVLNPEVKDWEMGLVRALYAQQRYPDVISMLEGMIEKDPENDALWALQANAYIGKKDMLAAAANFEVMDRMGKLDAKLISTLGDIYVNEGLLEVAADAYLRAYEKDKGAGASGPLRASEILLGKEGYEAARGLLSRVKSSGDELSADDSKRVMKLEAKIAQADGDEDGAAETLAELVAIDPLDGESLILLGKYYQDQSNNEKAAFYFETASNVKGFEADAKVAWAQLLVGEGKFEEALPKLKQAQDANPRDSVGRFIEDLERFLKGRRS
jgi:tetratricopeptide (TPR) repeat protein